MATRFFFGNIKVRLKLVKAKVTRGKDLFGKSEFFFGVSIKPRNVDFELFHQSAEAENCYGPFSKKDLSDDEQGRRGVQLGRRRQGRAGDLGRLARYGSQRHDHERQVA